MACWENLFNPLNQSDAKMKPLNYQWQWGRVSPTFEVHCTNHRIVFFFCFFLFYIHFSLNKLENVSRQVNIKYFKLGSDMQSCGCNNFSVRQVHVVIKTDGNRGGIPLDPPIFILWVLTPCDTIFTFSLVVNIITFILVSQKWINVNFLTANTTLLTKNL